MDKFNLRRPWSARSALIVVAGVAAFALLPVGASAGSAESGGLAALVTEVEALTGQSNTNTSDIAALQTTVTQQSAAILALQNALAVEIAARDQGDAATLAAANTHSEQGDAATLAAAKAYTDAETARALAAEAALANLNSGGSDDETAVLVQANTYTDSKVAIEAMARQHGDASTLASAKSYTDAETARAIAAEQALGAALSAEVNRALLAETAATSAAVAQTETNLTTLASNGVQGVVVTDATSFWQAIAGGNFP